MSDMVAGAPASRIAEEAHDGPLVGAARTVESAARRAKERVIEAKDRLAEKRVGEIVEDGRELVRANPVKSILVAAGVGALIGYAIGRRRS